MVDDAHKVICVHIPRTEGHTAAHAFGVYNKVNTTKAIGRHALPAQYVKVFPEKWNEYYKFTIIRNPFDRFVSIFSNGRRKQLESININNDRQFDEIRKIFNKVVIEELPKLIKKGPARPQVTWLRKNKREFFNFNKIIRQENYYNEVIEMLRELNVEPYIKIEPLYISNRRHYSEYYNSEAKKIMYTLYKEDFDLLEYSW